MADADQLRRTATVLEQQAADLTAASRRLEHQVSEMVFAGPAADEFRTGMADERRRLDRAASDLRSCAALMVREATAIEATGPAPGCCC